MGYEPLVDKNPLRVLKIGKENGNNLGLVMARPGLGKTALLVQIALDAILLGNRVVHVSIGESIDKTRVWYDDILRHILQEHSVSRPHELIDMVQHHRMIMTFKEASFTRSRLEERLNDLIMQDIFKPNCVVIDGLDMVSCDRASIEELKDLGETMSLQIWLSAVCHREDKRVSAAGVPAPCHEVDDLFDTVIVIKPEDKKIRLNVIKNRGEVQATDAGLDLDPTTMMIKKS
jgi:predicted ATP-dependent serine protease